MSQQPAAPSGLQTVPHLQWGSHLAHFFGSGDELRDLLVPYFKAGLENNEQCLWVTGEQFNAEQARSALRAAVPDLEKRERAEQIEIADGRKWYATATKIKPDELVAGLMRREQEALSLGYTGLRTNGNCAWVASDQWPDFLDYEALVQKAVRGRRMVCMCSYCMDGLDGGSHLEVMDRHDLAVPRMFRLPLQARTLSPVAGEIVSVQDAMSERGLRRALERQKRTFDLAMTASKMGTWRYTFADNICVYDENAQRLYGLTEARFLHDDDGVRSKFHPDDVALMWERVSRALDPSGDGRYDVEYRVKQLDGSWRWLSAWGLVEFEGVGEQRMPVAIAGASRDLTERKASEEIQRTLLNELNHRVKNTLSSVQAITTLTLRGARDLQSASDALDRRIRSMGKAHDLLTSRNWIGANLNDIVTRAVEALHPGQVTMSGPAIDVSPKHALALSLALHELGTNATKYGALSCSEGSVKVWWDLEDGSLQMHWEEVGGPPVAIPKRKGFGSRLLEELIVRDLGGKVKLDFGETGVRCHIRCALID
jgi:two-component sensor histidine kinase/PAS domain-containing protein